MARGQLARLRGVERAELDAEGGLAEVPNDADFWVQYALRNTGQVVGGVAGTVGADIRMTEAWEYTQGSPGIVIAVLDSGVDPHPELAGRILAGINVPDGNTATADECNHGTHVAGIIAASTGNGVGIAGIARTARILPVVVVNGCSGFESNVAAGLTWAVDQGARIVNMSLQFNLGGTPLQQAVQYAHAQGALIMAATGNLNTTPPAFPARWNETVAVASTDNRDLRSSFSNYGPEVDISAPGTNVWSLNSAISGYGYALKSGTSMATPHVSGVAALLWSYDPSLTRDEVRNYLVSTARDLGAPGTDIYYGAGRLDAAAALAAVPPPYVPEDLNQDGFVNAADLSLLLAAWGACADCDACTADIDGDCQVGASDLSLLLAAW
jgi:subtilisin family serine protease